MALFFEDNLIVNHQPGEIKLRDLMMKHLHMVHISINNTFGRRKFDIEA